MPMEFFMLDIINFSTFLLGTILIILIPGPNTFYILPLASKYGVKTAYKAILGILLGDFTLMCATIFGATSVLYKFPIIFTLIKLLGALYLAYLGFKILISNYQNTQSTSIEKNLIPQHKKSHVFKSAFLISILNPKAILFFLSFFVQFVHPQSLNPIPSFFVLALVVTTVSFLYLNFIVFFGLYLSKYFAQHHQLKSYGLSIIGILFIIFSLKLMLSSF